MAQDNPYIPPDLSSVLRTLASYSQSQGQTPSAPTTHQAPYPASARLQASPAAELEEGEYEPEDTLAHDYDPAQQYPLPDSAPPPRSATRAAPPATPTPIDISTLKTYPSALRHVSALLASNAAILARIKRLIGTQHEHEQQWWQGRLALLKRQEGRAEGRQKVNDVLRAVGGAVTEVQGGPSAADDEREVQRYDAKVHRACREMARATGAELTGLGIPFFGEGDNLDGERRKLQRKMIELLEDMCND